MELSKRLEAVISFVPKCRCVADIGTDHGYIPISLVKNQMAKKAIAMDIGIGPLKRAEENIKKYQLNDKVELRLSDGLHMLQKEEADVIVIAGMGGKLMVNILEKGKEKIQNCSCIILEPQSELYKVRKYIHSIGFQIIKENFVLDSGKYYPVLAIKKGNEIYDKECEYHFGKYMLNNPNPVFVKWLESEYLKKKSLYKNLNGQETESAKVRAAELKKEILICKEALAYHEMQGTGSVF